MTNLQLVEASGLTVTPCPEGVRRVSLRPRPTPFDHLRPECSRRANAVQSVSLDLTYMENGCPHRVHPDRRSLLEPLLEEMDYECRAREDELGRALTPGEREAVRSRVLIQALDRDEQEVA